MPRINITILTWCAILTLTSSTCGKPPLVDKRYVMIITNNSDQAIRVLVADEVAPVQYPDTNLPIDKPVLQEIGVNKSGYFDSAIPWDVRVGNLPVDTLSIYVLNGAIYSNVPWDSIRSSYEILERRDLSIYDLMENEYRLTYP